MARYSKKRRKTKSRISLILCIFALCAVLVAGVFGIKSLLPAESSTTDSTSSVTDDSASQPKEEEFVETTATILSTGDIMVHSTQLDGAKVSDGSYDFSAFFAMTKTYFKNADLSIANLEVTFGGSESGAYSGYPMFNTPDSLADVIKDSGLNLLLTSNNHSYDTGLFGLQRTARVLKKKGIEFIGTKETVDDPTYLVKNVNNINIGITNFTYETTGANSGGKKYLNGMVLKEEANNLVNSFNYYDLDSFYDQAEQIISGMKNDGAEFIVFYMHWGNEYQTYANTYQKSMAQELANLGVDIIIGSHPHVVQPIELITSEDGQNSTICFYSSGNAISNQRQEIMNPECPTGHTEDGTLFSFTLRKTKDGVILEDLDLIPTWVDKYPGGSGYQYTIYPLENKNDGSAKYDLDSSRAARAARSYDRTKAIVAKGLTECQKAVGCEVTFK